MRFNERLREAWSKNEKQTDTCQPAETSRTNSDLRQRLDRAWKNSEREGQDSGRQDQRSRTTEQPQTVEQVIGGRQVSNRMGTVVMRERRLPASWAHGSLRLFRYREFGKKLVAPDPYGLLAADEQPDLSNVGFFDTETTGLAGGTGTYIILAGVGFFDDEEFVVRQFFLRDLDDEPALLLALVDTLEQLSGLVTFNGGCFDIPLLQTRLRLHGSAPPPVLDAHWDLLHTSRRVYDWQLQSCALSSLEQNVLGFARENDVPGAEIPARYFAYLQEQDAGYLEGICEHNRDDVLSMVTLAAVLLGLVVDPEEYNQGALDLLGLARAYELETEYEQAVLLYRRGLEQVEPTRMGSGPTPSSQKVKLRLARLLKRVGQLEEAVAQWTELVNSGESLLEPHIELAKYYEHTRKEPHEALRLTERALALETTPTQHKKLRHRQRRLRRKAGQSAQAQE